MNKTTSNQVFLFLFITLFFSVSIYSNDMEHQHDMPMSEMEHHDMNESSMNHEMHNAAHLVPIGIMGGEVHMKGHFMMSIKQMRMSMEGNSNDDISLSDSEIINLPNPYTMMNMPSKLSVVPQEMEMNMTMIGGMYGVSDRQTLMFMGMYIEKDMNLLTYSPMMSRTLLGSFSSKTQGLSSVSISSLLKIKENDGFKMHAQIGIEKSVGENDDYGEVLTPMNMKKEIMLPYSMQIGDQSTSLLLALTLLKNNEDWSYGNQLKIKNNINKKDWNYGDSFTINGWISKALSESLSTSFRLSYSDQDPIKGRDTKIMAPVQTANPENYGGTIYEASLGLNKILKQGNILGLEITIPFKQKLNGPQMERDTTISLSFKKSL
jgi:hypothetical protein